MWKLEKPSVPGEEISVEEMPAITVKWEMLA